MILNVELIKKESKEKNLLLVSMVMDAGPVPTNRFDVFSPVERIVQSVSMILQGVTGSLPKTCEVATISSTFDQKTSQGTISAILKNTIGGDVYELTLKPQKHQAMLESVWLAKMGLPVEFRNDYKVNMKFSDGTILEGIQVKDGREFNIPSEFKGRTIDDVVITG